jgi:serine/threonine-protein kinase RsbW
MPGMATSELATNVTEAEATVARVALRIPARPELAGLCRLALAGFGRVHAVGGDAFADLELALGEAVSNAIHRASSAAGGGQLELTFDVRSDRVVIEVFDDGDGFDPVDVPVFDGTAVQEHGLALAIIETVADELELESAVGRRGTRLRFAKTMS